MEAEESEPVPSSVGSSRTECEKETTTHVFVCASVAVGDLKQQGELCAQVVAHLFALVDLLIHPPEHGCRPTTPFRERVTRVSQKL
jgi:hypothetical protein